MSEYRCRPSAIASSIPVTVQIRGVTTGLPNSMIFAEKVLAPGDVNLNAETKVVFANPFYAQAGTSYAVVLLTNSSNYRMRVATLGQLGQNGVITRQTYVAGVLLAGLAGWVLLRQPAKAWRTSTTPVPPQFSSDN